ncbi:MAG: sodium:solute symporter family transporter [Lachnospiraceae bacterium]
MAGKSLGTFSLAAMWLSSWIGGASIVGTSTNGYDYGVSGVWYVGILGIGRFIFGMTFSKLTERLGERLHDITYPALISSRYDNRAGAVVIVCCFLANIGFLSSQLVAMGSMLSTITGWETSTCFIISTAITIAHSAGRRPLWRHNPHHPGAVPATESIWHVLRFSFGVPFSRARQSAQPST